MLFDVGPARKAYIVQSLCSGAFTLASAFLSAIVLLSASNSPICDLMYVSYDRRKVSLKSLQTSLLDFVLGTKRVSYTNSTR